MTKEPNQKDGQRQDEQLVVPRQKMQWIRVTTAKIEWGMDNSEMRLGRPKKEIQPETRKPCNRKESKTRRGTPEKSYKTGKMTAYQLSMK